MTKSGVKLLDFGLAKLRAVTPGAVSSSASLVQTQTDATLTAQGTIIGTFQYMAPEILEGKEADPRSDIFALGALLFEVATGQAPFQGKTQASVIAAILGKTPPPISSVQSMMPPALDRVVPDLPRERTRKPLADGARRHARAEVVAEGCSRRPARPGRRAPSKSRALAWIVAAALAAACRRSECSSSGDRGPRRGRRSTVLAAGKKAAFTFVGQGGGRSRSLRPPSTRFRGGGARR